MIVAVDIPITRLDGNYGNAIYEAIAEIEHESGMALRSHVVQQFWDNYGDKLVELARTSRKRMLTLTLQNNRLKIN